MLEQRSTYVELVIGSHAAGSCCRAERRAGDLIPGSKVGFEVELGVWDGVEARAWTGQIDVILRLGVWLTHRIAQLRRLVLWCLSRSIDEASEGLMRPKSRLRW